MSKGSIMEFNSINSSPDNPFVITWDLGRRCNFDCSYCPSHRHDNFSKHGTLPELIKTIDFIQKYINTIDPYRKGNTYYISLTGGEPTVNPNFIKLTEYLEEWKKNFDSSINVNIDLTTNGAMSEKIANSICKHFDHVTISYHAEAEKSVKDNVLERILQFKNNNIPMKVNVMMHANYFDDCIELCNTLDNNSVKYIARPIGEDPDSILNTAHKYTDIQKEWFTNIYGKTMTKTTRPCCGGRSFTLCNTETKTCTETKVIEIRNFKDWYCSVNWHFLHIEQQTDLVFHHQTCQATFNHSRGSIGTLVNSQEIIDNLKNKLVNKTLETVVCPNKLCGCGLCIPKAKQYEDYLDIVSSTLNLNGENT